ncbi:MAG: succinate dehydrogenase/fumarate reductase iron-sulfur subunit [Candidatus Electrothrix aestuarii]|uniref:Succinate dehydrogenase/fumarate reductase iron-sulfur subunit n=1 Tax=Candidatus Electrothrix aestuarii TaxID=3062594 RepID=A0AAU8M229_9BACT|nr:succinate dehydrogenase/fumarate reductase iron-sulfur subunit [Candidatus Electrothrix aestuarii]
MAAKKISITVKVWQQESAIAEGNLETYTLQEISTDMSFLEMLDVLNEQLTLEGKEPVAFDHDCREGICGMCGAVVDGIAHGPEQGTTLCQLHMRHFQDGQVICIEPFRSRAFPVVKDLMVDRSAFDRIIQAGGFVSINTGSAPDANSVPVSQQKAEQAMDAAACIGCGACVAACPNAAAMLFTSAKISQLALMPQGRPERKQRALSMVAAMDKEGFGACSNHRECEQVCPKGISIRHIARMNREYLAATLFGE